MVGKIEGLSERVAAYPQERPHDLPLPPDYDTAKRIADEMERSAAECQDKFHTCENAAKNAKDALQAVQVEENVLATRIETSRTSKEIAERRLAAARDNRADKDLTAVLADAQEKTKDAQGSLKEVEAELDAADPDSLETLLENANETTKRATKELQSSREQARTSCESAWTSAANEGLHTLHDEAHQPAAEHHTRP